MRHSFARSFAFWGCLAPIVLVAPVTLQAADETIERIIVTAQKRETDLQDVPFSVSATTEAQIRNSGATNVVELSRNVSGLIMTDLGPGQSQVAIRGISAGQVVRDLVGGVKEAVGVYLDESAISQALFTPDLDMFDLERFEVLRGPQGTLFGAGSSAGTVRYITRQPQLGKFEGAAEVGAYTGTDTDVGGSLRGAVNLPMGDTAAARIVGYYNELAGFIDAYYPGRAVKEDVNDGEKYGARVSFLVKPNENLAITPRIVYQQLETNGYPRVDIFSILGNPYTTTQPPVRPSERGQVTQLREGIDDEFKLADLKLEVGFGGLTLTSITSYTDRDVVVLRDASSLTGSITFGSFGGTPAEVRFDSPLYDTTSLEVFSQEVRVASDGGGALEWLAGAFYQDINREYGQNLPTPGYDAMTRRTAGGLDSARFLAPPDTPYFSQVPFDFKQFALFGEATFHFTDEWSLTGGLRYYDFDEKRKLTFHGIFVDTVRTNEPGKTSSDGFSPRMIVAFQPNDDVTLTAQVSRGFRLGGINDPLNEGLCPRGTPDFNLFSNFPTFEDEKVLNYEIGGKTRWAGGRVTFNAAVFYSDIDGLQVIADARSCSSRVIANAQAKSVGAEFELSAQPTSNLDFALSATYAKAEITETRRDAQGQPFAGIRKGNRLPTSPEFQAAASATYSWPFTTALEGFANFTVQHVGSSYTQLADQEAPFGQLDRIPNNGITDLFNFGGLTINEFNFDPELPSYEIGNLRFGVRTDRYEAAAFINNLWDERAFLSLDRERGSAARIGYLTNPPRTYGVTGRVRF